MCLLQVLWNGGSGECGSEASMLVGESNSTDPLCAVAVYYGVSQSFGCLVGLPFGRRLFSLSLALGANRPQQRTKPLAHSQTPRQIRTKSAFVRSKRKFRCGALHTHTRVRMYGHNTHTYASLAAQAQIHTSRDNTTTTMATVSNIYCVYIDCTAGNAGLLYSGVFNTLIVVLLLLLLEIRYWRTLSVYVRLSLRCWRACARVDVPSIALHGADPSYRVPEHIRPIGSPKCGSGRARAWRFFVRVGCGIANDNPWTALVPGCMYESSIIRALKRRHITESRSAPSN